MTPRATEDTAGDSGNAEYIGAAAGKVFCEDLCCVNVQLTYALFFWSSALLNNSVAMRDVVWRL